MNLPYLSLHEKKFVRKTEYYFSDTDTVQKFTMYGHVGNYYQ